jgi:hypothetical protein
LSRVPAGGVADAAKSTPGCLADSFAAVHYRDTWYWIDSDNYEAKKVFTFLMMFFPLAEPGSAPQAPVLTLPAN